MATLRIRQAVLLALSCAAPLCAHGGMYRSPGGVIPPSATGGGGTAPGGAGPTGPVGPVGPGNSGASPLSIAPVGPTSPGPVGTGARGPGGVPIGEDLTRWAYWWEFRKDSFLRLKDAVHDTGVLDSGDAYFMGAGPRTGFDTLKPTHTQALGQIVPALHRALEATDQRDITSSCLIALAKIGLEDPHYHQLLPALRARLKSHDQEIRETAALALGISQRSAAVRDLVALLQDDDRGRKLCDRSEVDDRTRSFAAYGLGLIAWASPNAGVKRVVLDALTTVLDADDSIATMTVPVACINAIGLLRPEAAGERGDDVRRAALDTLWCYYQRDLGVGRQLVQSHVPPAAATLLRVDAEQKIREVWARRLVAELRSENTGTRALRRNRALAQSAALALGEMATPNEPGSADAWISEALIAAFEDGRDAQTGYFALTALGRAGGTRNRAFLLETLDAGTKALQKPWAALGLGMYEHQRIAAAGPGGGADSEVVAAIVAWLDEIKNPDARGAFAVALGLCQARAVAPRLRDLLAESRHQDELAGYLCVGLGLMNDRDSVDTIRDIVTTSQRRPQLLLQAAVALGRLGDKTAALLLMDQMNRAGQNLAVLASLSFAVGQIGDRRTVAPLITMVEDEARPALARAFAAVALGGVADKEPEPWNAKIGRQVNYRAAVETLTNQASGILDIL